MKQPKKKSTPRVTHWLYGWATILLLIWAVTAWGNDRVWWGTAVGSMPPQFWMLPGAFLFAIAVFGKNFRYVWVPALLCVGLQLGIMGWRWSWVQGSSMPTLKVMTWNIRHGERGLGAILKHIRAVDPDILLLQETHQAQAGESAESFLRRNLPEYTAVGGEETMILSKLRVRDSHVSELQISSGRRFVPKAEVEFEGQAITVYSVHLLNGIRPDWFRSPTQLPRLVTHAMHRRNAQIQQIESAISSDGPRIVGGDFNTLPHGEVYGHFAQKYIDGFAQAGRGVGFTFPDWMPTARIDQLWSTPTLVPVRVEVIKNHASDHFPVVGHYILKR